MKNINSGEYWDNRFNHDWQERGGENQSVFFSQIAISELPVWLTTSIKSGDISVCDWGCALGNGTAEFKRALNCDNVTGVDISPVAVEKAKSKFPGIKFFAADYLKKLPKHNFDILFTSNTLEHFFNPWEVAGKLSKIVKSHLIMLVPYQESGKLEEEHYYSFDKENIPVLIGEKFVLSFSSIVDTGKMDPSYWNGKQVLLIYSSLQALRRLNIQANTPGYGTSGLTQNVEKNELKEIAEHLQENISQLEKIIKVANTSLLDMAAISEQYDLLSQIKGKIDSGQPTIGFNIQKELLGIQEKLTVLISEKASIENARDRFKSRVEELLQEKAEVVSNEKLLRDTINSLNETNIRLGREKELSQIISLELRQLKSKYEESKFELGELQNIRELHNLAETQIAEFKNKIQDLEESLNASELKASICNESLISQTNKYLTLQESIGKMYMPVSEFKEIQNNLNQIQVNYEKEIQANENLRLVNKKHEEIYKQSEIHTWALESDYRNKIAELNTLNEDYKILAAKYYELLNSRTWRFGHYLRLPVYQIRKIFTHIKDEPYFIPKNLYVDRKSEIILSNVAAPTPTVEPFSFAQLGNAEAAFHNLAHSDIEKQQKKICLLVHDFAEGGVERVALDLALGFKNKSFFTFILVAGKGGRIMNEAIAAGLNVQECEGDIKRLENIVNAFAPDLVFVNHCYFGLDLLRNKSIPIIEIIHNLYFWQKDSTWHEHIRREYILHSIAVSKTVFDYSVKYLKIPQEKINIINNGLNIEGFIRPNSILRKKINEKKGSEVVFLHIAGFRASKCHQTVLSAFKIISCKYPNVRLWLAGNPDDQKIFDSIRDKIKNEHLEQKVKYLGSLSRRELSKIMLESDIALLPSSYEGFSIASLEYMFFGIPSIMTNVGAASDIIQNEDAGIVIQAPIEQEKLSNETINKYGANPDGVNIELLANAMSRMIIEQEEWNNKRDSIIKKADDFRIENTIEQYFILASGLLK